MRKKDTHLGFTALIIAGLILSLLLVLALDGARWLAPEEAARMQAEILLEDMDRAAAEALLSEQALTPAGGEACRLMRIDAVEPQKTECITADGRILLLPSESRFCARIGIELFGKKSAEGFFAFGNLPLYSGARIRLFGERMTGEGILISLTPL
jgi:hypothetical protein